VTARRDAYVAGFALLAAMGQAEAQDLGLEGGPLYNSAENYNEVRGRFSDFGDRPAPTAISPSTSGVPPQDAAVTRRLDPALDGSKVDRSPALTTGENAPNR
jgi:outer membrane protein